MKNKVAIIEDARSSLSNRFGLTKFGYSNELEAQEIDKSIKEFFKNNQTIEKIIIPIRLGGIDNLGLRFGLHIRLTKELGDKRYIPIIFTSRKTKEDILAQQIKDTEDLTATILFTQKVRISKLSDLQEHIDKCDESLDEQSYSREFFSKIILKNQREEGHQLANEWGVFRLARFAGLELKTASLPKDLFFKYSFIKSKQSIGSSKGEKIGLIKNDVRAVLIDDYVDKGWFEIVEHILKSNISRYGTKLEKIDNFDDAINFKHYANMDIVFLDLRLDPKEDKKNDTVAKIGDLSGMQILKKIKKINQGIQVIILTASNKSWNMKKMLDAGADGYFVKESPEIPLSDELSKANYESLIENIKTCLKKSYLRNIYRNIYKENAGLIDILKKLKADNENKEDFINKIIMQLEIAYSLLSDADIDKKNDVKFAFAFISLNLIIEIITHEFVSKEKSKEGGKEIVKWKVGNDILLDDYDKEFTSKPAQWQQFAGVYYQKWKQSDRDFVKNIRKQIEMRNNFMHPNKINEDIYCQKKGFQALFENIKKIIGFLSTSI